MDDYFFRNQKDRFFQLALSYLQNREEELDLYKADEVVLIKIKDQPDGTNQKPLTMGNLIEARRENASQAKELTQYIMDYERLRIADFCATENKNERQAKLMAYGMKHNGVAYIAFKQVIKWDAKNSKEIKDVIKALRIKCLHNGIPLEGSFRKQAIPDSAIGKALNIIVRLGKDKTKPNEYDLKNAPNEVFAQ